MSRSCRSQSAMLKLDRAVSIWLPGKDDGPDRDSLEAGTDDHSFRLDRTSLADCVPLADDKKEAAEMKAAK